jgi:hypothetical protein
MTRRRHRGAKKKGPLRATPGPTETTPSANPPSTPTCAKRDAGCTESGAGPSAAARPGHQSPGVQSEPDSAARSFVHYAFLGTPTPESGFAIALPPVYDFSPQYLGNSEHSEASLSWPGCHSRRADIGRPRYPTPPLAGIAAKLRDSEPWRSLPHFDLPPLLPPPSILQRELERSGPVWPFGPFRRDSAVWTYLGIWTYPLGILPLPLSVTLLVVLRILLIFGTPRHTDSYFWIPYGALAIPLGLTRCWPTRSTLRWLADKHVEPERSGGWVTEIVDYDQTYSSHPLYGKGIKKQEKRFITPTQRVTLQGWAAECSARSLEAITGEIAKSERRRREQEKEQRKRENEQRWNDLRRLLREYPTEVRHIMFCAKSIRGFAERYASCSECRVLRDFWSCIPPDLQDSLMLLVCDPGRVLS